MDIKLLLCKSHAEFFDSQAAGPGWKASTEKGSFSVGLEWLNSVALSYGNGTESFWIYLPDSPFAQGKYSLSLTYVRPHSSCQPGESTDWCYTGTIAQKALARKKMLWRLWVSSRYRLWVIWAEQRWRYSASAWVDDVLHLSRLVPCLIECFAVCQNIVA